MSDCSDWGALVQHAKFPIRLSKRYFHSNSKLNKLFPSNFNQAWGDNLGGVQIITFLFISLMALLYLGHTGSYGVIYGTRNSKCYSFIGSQPNLFLKTLVNMGDYRLLQAVIPRVNRPFISFERRYSTFKR